MDYLKKAVCSTVAAVMLVPGAWPADPTSVSRSGNAAQSEAGAGGVFAVINGQHVKRDYADTMLNERAQLAQTNDASFAKGVEELLITNELFVQEAIKRGLDKRQEVIIKSEMLRRDVLANAFIQTYFQEHPVEEQAIMEEYERRKVPLLGGKEFSVRHILLRDKGAAEELIKQLQGGAEFARLVEQRSLDEGASRNYGGSLGWISTDNSEAALVQAVASLKVGEIAPEPASTRFGWHVLQLDDVRDIQILPFDAVKERLRQQLQQARAEQLGRELRTQANIIWPDERAADSTAQLRQ